MWARHGEGVKEVVKNLIVTKPKQIKLKVQEKRSHGGFNFLVQSIPRRH